MTYDNHPIQSHQGQGGGDHYELLIYQWSKKIYRDKLITGAIFISNDFVLYLGENQLTDLQPALSAFWICVSYFFVFCVILDLGENHRADQGLPSHYPFSISLLMRKSLELDKTPTQAPIYTFDYPNASNHHSCYLSGICVSNIY